MTSPGPPRWPASCSTGASTWFSARPQSCSHSYMWSPCVRLRRRGDAWPVGRTAAWLLGCLVLLFATSSGVGRYMPAMFSMHMAAHMLLSMLTPILLVLGAPVTLALRALPAAGRGDAPGPREWLLAALHSRLSRVLTNPFVATILFVAGFYGLYFGGIFDAAVDSHPPTSP